MTLLWLPVLLALDLTQGERRSTIFSRRYMAPVLIIFLFLAVYGSYNAARFGSPLDTGYGRMVNLPGIPNDLVGSMERRIREIGIFASAYVIPNFLYLFFQGPHIELVGRYRTQLGDMDQRGISVMFGSPWLLLAWCARIDRCAVVIIGTIACIIAINLFYHSNGYVQVSNQRYTLDWLPLAVVLIARTPRTGLYQALPVLVCWGAAISISLVYLAFVKAII